MKLTSALLRLERQLTRDRATILDAADVRLLARQLRRAIKDSLPELPAEALDRSDDLIRWHSLGARCKDARGARGLRDVAVASGIPQYRIRAIESGHRSEIRPDVAQRYFRFLGIEDWVARWCRSNRELAIRAGLLDPEPRGPSTRGRRAVGRGSDAKSSTR